MQKIDELNEEVNNHNVCQQQYTLLAEGDRQKLLEEITSLRKENAGLQTKLDAEPTSDINEKLLEELRDLRNLVREAQAAAVVAANFRSAPRAVRSHST
jgi:hypothetical protein